MKILLILVAGFLLISCGSKKTGSSNGGSSGSRLAPTVSIATDLADITMNNIATFIVSGTCSEEGQPVTVDVEGISPETAPLCTAETWSTEIDLSRLTGPSREVSITADHSIDNLTAPQASKTVTLYPRVIIADSVGNITGSTFTVSGTCSEEGQSVTVDVGGVNPVTAPTCTSTGTWSVSVDVSHLLTGASRPITITADHSTSGGLDATQTSKTVALVPRVSIADSVGNITGSTFTVNGTCSENGQAIIVDVGGVNPVTAPLCTTGTWSVSVDVSDLGASGSVDITADHSTSGGLAALQASKTVTLYPRVGIAATVGNITEATFVVSGTCSENGQPVTVGVGGVSPTAPTCTIGIWSVSVDVSHLLTGASRPITITADHSTSGANSLDATQASKTVALAPRVSIADSVGNITGSTFAVSGTCSEDGQAITVDVGGVSPVTAPTCTSTGTWSVSVDVSSLLTGASRPIAITADHSTSGGLDALQASKTVTLYPRVGIAATVGNITGSTFAVNGTCSENGQPVTVDVGGVNPVTAPLCTTGTWSTSVDVSGLGASGSIDITANHSTSGANSLDALQASKTVTLYPRVGIAATVGNITVSTFAVSGTCSEDGQSVTVNVGGVSPTTAPTCTSTGTWSVSVDVSSLLTGASRPITITADHSTSGANSLDALQASKTVTLYPRVGIADSVGNITGSIFAVNGTCSENGQPVTVDVGGVSPTAPTCTSTGTWSVSVDVSGLGASGSVDITANHSTSGGLAALQASKTVTLYPRVGIADSVGNITGSTFAVNGTCSENGQPVTVDVGGVSPTAPTCTIGIWSVSVDVSSLLTGASRPITITADHSTSGANSLDATQASKTVTLYPRVSIADSVGNITGSTFAVNGICSENGQPVTVDVGGVSPTAPTCTTGTWSVSVDVSSLLTGASRPITITADHSTSGANSLDASQASKTVALAPRVSIADSVGNITGSTFAVNGTCSEDGQPVTVDVGGISPTAPLCTRTGTWSVSVDVSGLGASGPIDITADHSTSGANSLDALQASKTVTLYPRVGIAATVGNITGSTFAVNGTCSEEGQSVTVDVGGVSPTAPTCTSTGTWSVSVDVSSLLTGASRPITITADHSTSGANSLDALQASKTVTLYPRVSIADSVGNITGSTFAVNGTCSENGQPVTVDVGGVSPVIAPLCTTETWSVSVDVSSLLTGASRPITITADHSTSGANSLDAPRASKTVALAPRVSIADSVGNITGSTFTVNGTCSENGQTIIVDVGGASPVIAPLCTIGAWSVSVDVSGLGASGSVDITADHSTSGGGLAAPQASKTVTLYPRVGIAATVGNITGSTFTVNGTCSEDGQPVTVDVGGVSPTAPTCTSTGTWSVSVDVSGLLTGASRPVTITADHSTSGGLDATQASKTVALAPRVSIADSVGNITGSTFAVNGTCSENGQPVTVDVGGVSPVTDPTCTTGTWSVSVDVSGLGASGSVDITADHSTSGGLAAPQASKTVTLYPRVGIAATVGNITGSTFTVNGTCSEDGQPVTVDVGGVSPTAPTCTSTGTWSVSVDVSSLLTGASRPVTITADHSTSGANSLDALQASKTVTLAPRVSIADSVGNITESTLAVNGTCSENGQPVTVDVGGVSPTAPTCTTGTWSVSVDVSSLLTGASRPITITADHSTSGGLAAPQASKIVALAPRVGIAATVGNITGSTFAVSGTCSENGQPVTVDVGGVSPDAAPLCTTETWSVNVDVSGLLTGASRPITITADHSTSGGLAAPQVSKTVTLYPRVIIADSVGNITGSTFVVNGTCSENGQPVIVDVGGVSPVTAPLCTTETWSVSVDVSGLGASGSIDITANHSTSGANSLDAPQASKTVTLYPRVSIADSVGNITVSTFAVNGTCSENGQPVIVDVGGVSPVTAPLCTTGTWSVNVDVSGLLTGASRPIDVTADHSTSGVTPLAALQASKTVTLYPRVSIAATVGNITGSTFAVSGTCSENGQPVTVDVGGVSPETAPLCTTETWSVNVDVSGLGASGPIDITANHSTSGASPLAAIQASKIVTLYPRVTLDTESLVDITFFNAGTFPVSGTCSEEGQPVEVSVGTISASPAPTCTIGTWSVNIDVGALSGTSVVVNIIVNHSTSSGLNALQATANVLLHPTISINTRVLEDITSTNAANFSVRGHCSEEGQPVEVSVGTVSPETNPNCTNGAWTVAVDVTGLNQTPGTILITADHSLHPQATVNVTNYFICPENYVGVPALAGYTTNSFCMMKYEAKRDGSPDDNAISEASGTPYVSIRRTDSIDKCTAIGDGYDLITNDEWQSLARNIELVPDNWATGVVGNAGGLSRGHTDNGPNRALAANSDDNESCFGTGQDCDNGTWHHQRRTFRLSNGEVVWDVAGNVWEWVKDDNEFSYGPNAYFSQVTAISHPTSNSLSNGTTETSRSAKDQFGPSGDYTNLNTNPYGGLGRGSLNVNAGTVARGRNWSSPGGFSGLFSVTLHFSTENQSFSQGFRCVFRP